MNIKKNIRIIFRNKTYSLLNIAGLTIGITSAILIFLWVNDKVSFNQAIPNSKNIYIAGEHSVNLSGQYKTFFSSSYQLSKTLESEFPEVKRSTCYSMTSLAFVPENTTDSFEEKGAYADSTIFEMIGLTFIHGDISSVFNPANPIVISKSMAQKLYGTENSVGKGLLYEEQLYEITGVFRDLPDNTTFNCDWLIPFRIQAQYAANLIDINSWGSIWMNVYAELEPNVNIDQLNEKLKTLAMEKGGPEYDRKQIFLYPLNRTLLYGEFKNGIETGSGYINTVSLFFLIGVLILLIACINFMNLSTARSQKRALEIGLRKTFGTKRKSLIRQFLIESGLITLIALALSVVLVWLSLPFFNNLIKANLSFNLFDPVVFSGLVMIGLFCTFLSGSYPAIYLSSFNPITILKLQKTVKGSSAAWIRQILVIFQFTMAFVLVCSTYVIYLQIQLAQNRDIGLEKDNLIVFSTTKELTGSYAAVQSELKNTGLVESSGFSSQSFINMGTQMGPWFWTGKDPGDDASIHYGFVSEGVIEAAGMKLIDGADFNPIKKDKEVIINEALARRMGDEGRVGGKIGQNPEQKLEIAGIIKDFVFNNPYMLEPAPVIFFHDPEQTYNLFVRLKADVNTFDAIGKIQSVLQTFSPHLTFSPTLMTDRFNHMFEQERLVEKLSGLFAILAIFISCLGLLGLSAYSAEQRTKEIGVRKVLGANITDILMLLGKSYLLLLLVSFAIGIPISIYLTQLYLKSYAYRIILSWDIFLGVALLITLIALFTISILSVRAATANPVKSIKTE